MLLVRTPPPGATESLFGYVLRVSEANGYDSPWHVMHHAGMDQSEMFNTVFPIEKLAQILGMPPDTLVPIAYSHRKPDSARDYRLLGHSFGGALACAPFRHRRPAFCPSCVAARGFVDAFWDLRVAVACPVHRCYAVSHCCACKRAISDFRPGLLVCKCGASLATPRSEEVPAALLDLMHILHAKVHRQSVDSSQLTSGLPVKELMGMELKTLILKLLELGGFSSERTEKDADITVLLTSAAQTLSEWPRNFRVMLRRIGSAKQTSGTSFLKRFKSIYGKLASRKVANQQSGWLRDEFLRFGLEEWGESLMDDKLFEGAAAQRRFVNKAALARHLGVRVATISQWAKRGYVTLKATPVSSSSPRYIVDMRANTVDAPLKSDGVVLETRVAAAHLGIPVRVLDYLNDQGHLPAVHKPRFKIGYARADLDLFLQRLLDLSPVMMEFTLQSKDDGLVSLGSVLRYCKFHNHASKAEFVVAYLASKCTSIGRSGDSVGDILLRKSDVHAYVAASRSQAADDSLAQWEAAKHIGCDPMAIPGLIANGSLHAVPAPTASRIRRTSVQEFVARYTALSALANELWSTSYGLRRICQQEKLPVMSVTTRYGVEVCFVDNSSIEILRMWFDDAPPKGPERREWKRRQRIHAGF